MRCLLRRWNLPRRWQHDILLCRYGAMMGINLVIAVTDGDWFEMLRTRPNLGEVNFWAPSAANFRALRPGEMFLFKLHAPRNVIVNRRDTLMYKR